MRDKDVRALVDRAVAAYGRLDCAFNNAGVEGAWAPVHEADDAEFDRVVGANLRGPWRRLTYELAALYAGGRGGAVVATSSFLALGASPNTATYAASKAGLDALMRAAALEAGPRGVRLNTVRPGVIDTPMFCRGGSAEVARPLVAYTPLGRLGAPEDVAGAAVWLCTDAARFVTGQALVVDGGFTMARERERSHARLLRTAVPRPRRGVRARGDDQE